MKVIALKIVRARVRHGRGPGVEDVRVSGAFCCLGFLFSTAPRTASLPFSRFTSSHFARRPSPFGFDGRSRWAGPFQLLTGERSLQCALNNRGAATEETFGCVLEAGCMPEM